MILTSSLIVEKPDKAQNLSSEYNTWNNKSYLNWGITPHAKYYRVYVSNKPDFDIFDKNDLIHISDDLADTEYSFFAPFEGELYFKVAAFNKYDENTISDTRKIVNKLALVSGTVTDKTTGVIIKGAEVSIDVADTIYKGFTNLYGFFYIKVPEYTDYLIVNINASGYLPSIIQIPKKEIQDNKYLLKDLSLTQVGSSHILINGGEKLYHLGNDLFGGSVNSQLQKGIVDGTEVTLSFDIQESKISAHSTAKLYYRHRGAQPSMIKSYIYINGNKIDYFPPSNSNGSFNESFMMIDLGNGTVKPGRNEIKLTSSYYYNEFYPDGDHYDDFEITNLYIELSE